MIWNMFINTIATIMLSTSNVTVINFKYPIEKYTSGANKLDLYKKISNDKKTLILRPLIPNLKTNIVVITSGGVYNFDLKVVGSNPHRSIYIQNGKKDTNFISFKDTHEFEILKGTYTYLIRAKVNLKLNGELLEAHKSKLIALGPPILINDHIEVK